MMNPEAPERVLGFRGELFRPRVQGVEFRV